MDYLFNSGENVRHAASEFEGIVISKHEKQTAEPYGFPTDVGARVVAVLGNEGEVRFFTAKSLSRIPS